MDTRAQIEGRAAMRRAGVWPAVQIEETGQAVPQVLAAARTQRALAPYGAGRVLQITHRVHVAIGAGRAQGSAELDIDGWTGEVLRLRYQIAFAGQRIEAQECGSFKDHDAPALKVALRLARRAASLSTGERDLVSSVAGGLERRCRKTLCAVRSALASDDRAC